MYRCSNKRFTYMQIDWLSDDVLGVYECASVFVRFSMDVCEYVWALKHQ